MDHAWLEWFLTTHAEQSWSRRLLRMIRRSWPRHVLESHRADGLLSEQIKVLKPLLDGGVRMARERGSVRPSIRAVGKKSTKATATRHLD